VRDTKHAGSIAAFMCWAFPRRGGGGVDGGDGRRALMHAAYGGCAVVRAASARAFAERRRSMLAGDIIPHLQGAFEELFPDA
jgi:NAD(P)H-hydrate repair Nnr-like enzyme with NAD(P)H-hydrate dehydratase domain